MYIYLCAYIYTYVKNEKNQHIFYTTAYREEKELIGRDRLEARILTKDLVL